MEKQCGAVDGSDKRPAWSYHHGGGRSEERRDGLVIDAAVVDAVAVGDAETDALESDGRVPVDMSVMDGVVEFDCSSNAM